MRLRARGLLTVAATTFASVAMTTLAAAPPAAASSIDWTQLSPTTAPAARDSAGVAYDDAAGHAVLFGGETAQNGAYLGDTWTWDGSQWSQQSPATSPSPRQAPGMAYDPTTGQVVLFGGYAGGFLADTWTWDGTTWTQQQPALRPPARDYMGMAYYPALGGIVLFSGLTPSGPSSDTWLWANGAWTKLGPPVNAVPPARYGTSMVYDAGLGALVMFGGLNTLDGALSDAWTFDGVAWTPLSVGGPQPRSAQHLVFDAHLGNELLFGGGLTHSSAFFGDTWEFRDGHWTQLTPATSPSPRANAASFYDAAHCQMVVFGGTTAVKDVDETWTYGSCDAPSDECAGPTAITLADGWVGDVYGRVRVVQLSTSTIWLCVRVDGAGIDAGAKIVVSTTPPSVQIYRDPPGGQAPPEPAPASANSGSCETEPGALRLADVTTIGDSRAYAYASQPAAGQLSVCARADLLATMLGLGGVLTLNPGAAFGPVPTPRVYQPTDPEGSDPYCRQPVVLTSEHVDVFISSRSISQPQPTVCLYTPDAAPIGVTLEPSPQGQPTVTWTPDPGTPVPPFSL